MHTHPQFREIAFVYRALSNERRLFLLSILARRSSMTGVEMLRHLGIRPPALSRHVHVLLRSGILQSKRKGTSVEFLLREGVDVLRIFEKKNLFAKRLTRRKRKNPLVGNRKRS